MIRHRIVPTGAPMILDMPTVSLVTFSATTVLGLVLCFVWWRERSSALIGWWGLAQLVMASGIGLAVTAASIEHPSLSVFGQALMVMSAAILWMAVRQFEGREFNPLWIAVWPCGVVIAAASGLVATFDQRLILVCTLMATLNLMAAAEFTYQEDERLVSRWPAIVLLIVTATGLLRLDAADAHHADARSRPRLRQQVDAGRHPHLPCSAASPWPSSCSPW